MAVIGNVARRLAARQIAAGRQPGADLSLWRPDRAAGAGNEILHEHEVLAAWIVKPVRLVLEVVEQVARLEAGAERQPLEVG